MQTIDETVKATEDGTKTVAESVTTANQTVQTFIGVRDAISRASESTQNISANAQEQSLAVNDVLRAMTEFGEQRQSHGRHDRSRADRGPKISSVPPPASAR